MNTLIGLIIIAIGAFCQSSSYVPINKIKSWSWESYWLVQGVFAWLVIILIISLILEFIKQFIVRRAFVWKR